MKKVKITNSNDIEIEVSPEFAKVIDQINNCKSSEIITPSNEIPIDRQTLMLDLLCSGNEDKLLNIIRFRYGINPKRNSFSDNIYCDGFKIENLQSILNYIESLDNQTDNYDHLKLIKSVITKIISDVHNYKSRETSITFGQLPIDEQIQFLELMCFSTPEMSTHDRIKDCLDWRYGINPIDKNNYTSVDSYNYHLLFELKNQLKNKIILESRNKILPIILISVNKILENKIEESNSIKKKITKIELDLYKIGKMLALGELEWALSVNKTGYSIKEGWSIPKIAVKINVTKETLRATLLNYENADNKNKNLRNRPQIIEKIIQDLSLENTTPSNDFLKFFKTN